MNALAKKKKKKTLQDCQVSGSNETKAKRKVLRKQYFMGQSQNMRKKNKKAI